MVGMKTPPTVELFNKVIKDYTPKTPYETKRLLEAVNSVKKPLLKEVEKSGRK